MKKITLLVATALLAATSFTSCSKEDDPTPATPTSLLTAKNWRITAFTVKQGNQPVEDVYKNSEQCEKDDFYQFKTDKTMVFDQGKERCNPTEPQTSTGAWDINADGNILLLLEMKGATDAELYEIKELNSTKLHIGQTFTVNGEKVLTDITFASF